MKIIYIALILFFEICSSQTFFIPKNESEVLQEILVDKNTPLEYFIKPDISYVFTINDDNYFYCFSSLLKDIFYVDNKTNPILELSPNETFYEKGEKIYINYMKDIKEEIKIQISLASLYNELNSFETINENQYFFIKSESKSIAYFDSFDMNSKVYISE